MFWIEVIRCIRTTPLLSLFSQNMLQNPSNSPPKKMQVILQKKTNPVLPSCHPLRPNIPSWAFRRGDSTSWDRQACPHSNAHKRALDAQVGGLKSLTGCHPGFLAPGGSSGARNWKHCKRGKKKKREQRGRDSQRESCWAVIRWFAARSCGGAICWGR